MINIFQPSVGQESLDNLKSVFESNWLGRGDISSRFLKELANFLGCETENLHTVASCSDAIFAVFKAFDMPAGAKVIVPSVSFPAVGAAILENGFEPVIVDISIENGNICLDSLKANLTSDVAAVFVTDYGGIPCDVAAIRELVSPSTLIFQDSAAALGTFIDGKFSGCEADFCCWSFDAMKLVTCGEGGGVYFKDPEATIRFKEYTYLGFCAAEKSGLDRASSSETWWEYNPICAGRRSVFTNVNAAIGLPSLLDAKRALKKRDRIRAQYTEIIDTLPRLDYLKQGLQDVEYSNYFFTVSCEKRNQLAAFLKEHDIYNTFRYHPMHKMDLFQPYARDCANAEAFSRIMLNIPIHQSLSDEDVNYICSKLIEFKA